MATLSEVAQQGLEIIVQAESKGAPLRLLGGAAIWLHTTGRRDLFDTLQRPNGDLDFVAYAKHSGIVKKVMTEFGFEPNVQLNAYHGHKRQLWYTPNGQIDIIFNVLEMCHPISFERRLELDKPTVTVSDLLLSKMQIVKLNEKDVKDIMILLREHEIGSNESDTIDVGYISELLADNWGFYYTSTTNFQTVRNQVTRYERLAELDRKDISGKIDVLSDRIIQEPKTFKWKMREKIGTKVRWYNVVEEVIR